MKKPEAWGIPKINPLHRPSQKKRNQAAYRSLRPDVRADTFARDGGRCRCPCHRLLYLKTDNVFQLANIHETEGPRHEAAIDISLRRTITLAPECHGKVERNQLTIVYGDEDLKCNGPVTFTGTLATGRKVDGYVSAPVVSFEEFRANRRASNEVRPADPVAAPEAELSWQEVAKQWRAP